MAGSFLSIGIRLILFLLCAKLAVTVRKHYPILEKDEEVDELSQIPTYSVFKDWVNRGPSFQTT
jgi:hypothetical protein